MVGSKEGVAFGPIAESPDRLMPRLVIHPRFDLDVLEVFDYLAARSHRAAYSFLDAVTDARQRLAANPVAGALFPRIGHEHQEWRFLHLKGMESYLVLYKCTPETTTATRIIHGSRDLEAALRWR